MYIENRAKAKKQVAKSKFLSIKKLCGNFQLAIIFYSITKMFLNEGVLSNYCTI